jgi:hypothetical protein
MLADQFVVWLVVHSAAFWLGDAVQWSPRERSSAMRHLGQGTPSAIVQVDSTQRNVTASGLSSAGQPSELGSEQSQAAASVNTQSRFCMGA